MSAMVVPLAQIAAIVWLIWRRTPAVPTYDEWVTVGLVQRFDQGQVTWHDFWAFHVQHRIVIPRIVNLTLIEITSWNRQIEMTFNIALMVAAAVLLVLALRQTLRNTVAVAASVVPVSILFFAPGQYENWLQPFQLAFLGTSFGVVLALWALSHTTSRVRWLVVAITGAMIATLCSAAGLVAWVALIPAVVVCGYRVTLWLAVALPTVAVYVAGLPATGHQSGPIMLANAVRYSLAYLGAPLGDTDLTRATLFGAGSVLLMVAVLVTIVRDRALWKPGAVWVSLALFAAGCDLLSTYARLSFGVNEALQSRYQTFSSLWWIALIALVARIALHIRPTRRALTVVPAVAGATFFLTLVASDLTGFDRAQSWLDYQRHNQGCVIHYDICPDSRAYGYYFAPSEMRRDAAYLSEHHLAIFHGYRPSSIADLKPAMGETLFALNKVGTVDVSALMHASVVGATTDDLVLEGWAVDTATKTPASGVSLLFDGAEIPTVYGADRPDVAAYYHTAPYRYSGFYLSIPANKMTPGTHRLQFEVLTPRGSYYQPVQDVTLTITASAPDVRLPGTTLFTVDAIAGQPFAIATPHPITVTAGVPVILEGWAVDTDANRPAAGVVASVDGETVIAAQYGIDRADVAQFFNVPAFRPSGYRLTIPPGALPVGQHLVSVRVLAASGVGQYMAPNDIIINVVGA